MLKDWIAAAQVRLAMTGRGFALNFPRHCERSEAIQEPRKQAPVSSTPPAPPIGKTRSPERIDLDQATARSGPSNRAACRAGGTSNMDSIRWIIATAPEIFLLLSIAIGTLLGRVRVLGFSLGT